MALSELVQTRIDPEIKERAALILGRSGLTVSDAVRMLLTRTANEGVLPLTPAPADPDYDAWFRTKVQEGVDDPRPVIASAAVEAYFSARRAVALTNADATGR